MSGHLSREALRRLLQSQGDEEVSRALRHVASCAACRAVAAGCLAQERTGERPPFHSREARNALVLFLEAELNGAIEMLKAGSWWAGLRDLSPSRQLKKVRSTASLQTVAFVETILADARAGGLVDPFLGESFVRTALAVVDLLPAFQASRALKNDLRGRALAVAANCRRLAADFSGAAAAFEEARGFLAQGTGNPGLEAGLLSLHCSLCIDRGDFEQALVHVRRAVKICKDHDDCPAAAHNTVLEAGCLLAADRPDEAVEAARFALDSMPPQELRLQILARLILTESLLLLKRPYEAIFPFMAARSLCAQADPATRLRALYCEALLLDGLGEERDSERLFRHAIKVYFDQELYKEAFRALLALFESCCRRGATGKAVALCDEAIAAASQAGEACNERIRQAWEELREVLCVRRLSDSELIEARQFLVRNWSVTAGVFVLPRVAMPEALATVVDIPEPPPVPAGEDINPGSYRAALHSYERTLIESALNQAGGNRAEACRRLGIWPNTLKKKMQEHGL